MNKLSMTEMSQVASDEIEAIIRKMPQDLRVRLESVAVIFEQKPNKILIADGVEADTLGIFLGETISEESSHPLPPQIILFLSNIWDFSEENRHVFRAEIAKTFLHEMGHFLGLDEQELEQRGLQ